MKCLNLAETQQKEKVMYLAWDFAAKRAHWLQGPWVSPSKAHLGQSSSHCAPDLAQGARCSPDLLETEAHTPMGFPCKEQTKLRLLHLEIRFQEN